MTNKLCCHKYETLQGGVVTLREDAELGIGATRVVVAGGGGVR